MQELFGETILAVGHGLLPSNTATSQIYHVLTMAAEVEAETHKVLEASVTLVTPVTARWVERLIVGNDLDMSERYVNHLARLRETKQ